MAVPQRAESVAAIGRVKSLPGRETYYCVIEVLSLLKTYVKTKKRFFKIVY